MNAPDGYVAHACITGDVTHEIIVKKSRFICDLIYAKSKEDAAAALARIKKQHYDARHHCNATILFPDRSFMKASDDGEPQGTAGQPMLEILRGSGLTNIIAIVTRYFGGTLLGTGGLARAYTDSVRQALDETEQVHNLPAAVYEITLPYADYGKLTAIASELGAGVDGAFLEQVRAKVVLPMEDMPRFEGQLTEMLRGGDNWNIAGYTYIKKPV